MFFSLGYIHCVCVSASCAHLKYRMCISQLQHGAISNHPPQLSQQRVSTTGHEAEGSEPPLEKLVKTSVLSLVPCCLEWMYHNGRKITTAYLTMRELKFNSLHSITTEHPMLCTKQKSMCSCVSVVQLCVWLHPMCECMYVPVTHSLNLLHWPIKITPYGGKRNWLLLKQGLLQYSPGGRHANDVTLWNT